MKVLQIPTRLLGVFIFLLGFVGVYTLRNSINDCIIAAAFGVLGVILRRLDQPIVPIILGMVLGNIMEVKLRSAMPRIDGPLDFINRPIAAIIFAIIVFVIARQIRATYHSWRDGHQADEGR
nr:tripartite tricarboxylate transporter permease [uncultured Cohaesibacter sp.]